MSANKALKRAAALNDARMFQVQGAPAQSGSPVAKLPLITDTTEWITPEKAQEMLQKNRRNRPIKWNRVDEIAATMRSGKWVLTPQGIVLDGEGNILTGQHRLLGVVRSGVTCAFRISRGNDPGVAMVLDRGAPQSARDLASRSTERKHSQTESSVARAISFATGNPKPSVDDLARIMADKSDVIGAMMVETKGTKKGRAELMIIGALAVNYIEAENAAIAVLDLPKYVRELEKRLEPETADKCWGKGAAFTLAMRTAREVVS